MNKALRGGARKGAGRKTKDGASNLRRATITIDPQSEESLKQLGSGDLSLGVRLAASEIMRRRNP